MKRLATSLLLVLSFAGVAQGQSDSGFYLELGSCTACGAYGNQIVRLLKQSDVNAFNGYAQCTGEYGSCFSTGQYANATKIIRSRSQGSEVGVIVGPFQTLDSALGVMRRLRSILHPVFDNDWAQRWGNSPLRHRNGNSYEIQPLTIWIIARAVRPIAPRGGSASQDWDTFWKAFSAAVNKRDILAMKRLTAPEKDFFSGGGGETREQWLQAVEKNKWWGLLQKSVRLGIKPFDWDGEPTRVTKDDHLCFRFLRGRWRFVGPCGD